MIIVKAYIVPEWLTLIGGLIIFQHQPKSELKVLFGLRSARVEAGKWCLPTGLGAIRRDISAALSAKAPQSLENPEDIIRAMSERHQQAFQSPAGFALAEAKWYVQIPVHIGIEQLVLLNPICQLDGKSLLIKIYFGLEWLTDKPPRPAKTEWPFEKVKFFSKKELGGIPIAFGCDKDLDQIFWRRFISELN